MPTHNKVNDKLKQAEGKVREEYGKATDDEEQEIKGKLKRAEGETGEAIENAKDEVEEKLNR